MKTKIEILPEMRRWNDLVQLADSLTAYECDRDPAEQLIDRLEGLPGVAWQLREAGEAIGYLPVPPKKCDDTIFENRNNVNDAIRFGKGM